MTSVTVVGTGYLGTTHAVGMAELGFDVLGVDVDTDRTKTLSDGEAPFYEPGLESLLRTHLESGRLRFGSDLGEAAEVGDVHFICVGTPQRKGEFAADMRYVDGAVEELAAGLTRPGLVVGKSTVPVGTAARLAERVAELAPAGREVNLAWNPEFLREGFAVQDTMSPDRIVVGVSPDPGRAAGAEAQLRQIYARAIGAGTPFLVTGYATSELVKAAANSFLATKISFINAMAEVCDAAGADVTVLADAIGHDPRIGRRFLNAGLGFGGGCLPKDIRAFMARAGELGVDQALTFLREVDSINMRRRTQVVETARDLLGGSVLGLRIGVLGAAFKPDSDDVRDSPALNVAGQLQLQGAQVTVYDPQAMGPARRLFPTLEYGESMVDACRDADLVLLLTEWPEFVGADPVSLGSVVRERRILDGRNVLDPQIWAAAGWSYRGVGRPGV
jgi:UDPglucose 6-dehydrogenase